MMIFSRSNHIYWGISAFSAIPFFLLFKTSTIAFQRPKYAFKRSFANAAVQRIVLPASDIAAIIGANPYKAPNDVLESLWQKYQSETKTFRTSSERAIEVIQSDSTGKLMKILTQAVKLAETAGSSQEAQQSLLNASSQLEQISVLSSEQKLLAQEYLRGAVSTTFGVQAEQRTAQLTSAEIAVEGKKLLFENKYFSMPVLKTENRRFDIVGKIDGLEMDREGKLKLVEIKNRMKRLFREVRPYEYIQVQVYLRLVGLDSARLIEQYNQETHSMDVAFDSDNFDKNVFSKVIEFSERFDNLLQDPETRKQYVANRKLE